MLGQTITPHKQGRDSRIPSGRLSSETVYLIKEAMEAQGITLADYLTSQFNPREWAAVVEYKGLVEVEQNS